MPGPPGERPMSGRCAVVTGGAGGIGGEVRDRLVHLGASVAVLDCKTSALHAPRSSEGTMLELHCDVADEAQVTDAFFHVEEAFGPISLFVASTGVDAPEPFVDLKAKHWRNVVDASLTGTFLTLQAAVRSMRRAGGGRAVALSSGWATKGYPSGAHYAAAKAGVEAMVKSVAQEEAAQGILVNAVAPGPVRTAMTTQRADFSDWEAARAAAIPLGRIGEPRDVASIVMYLLSQENTYVTGQVWHVNGGLLMP